ncbi:MAG: WG repeat-containing protein [Bacteroidaceae bacterium]|nr:WG repeat-containing protein [Bacteroidaceae bacterium]
MKRLFVAFCLCSFLMYSYAYDFKAKDANGKILCFKILSDNTVAVARDVKPGESGNAYEGYAEIEIPKTVENEGKKYTVAEIDESAFLSANDLISIKIPSTVRKVGLYAFANCEFLEKIEFPDNIQFEVSVSPSKISKSAYQNPLTVQNKKGGKKVIFADKYGTPMIKGTFDEASPFDRGIAFVKKNGKWGIIDKKGNIVIPFVYNNYGGIMQNKIIVCQKGDKWGAVDLKNDEVVPFMYINLNDAYNAVNGDVVKTVQKKQEAKVYKNIQAQILSSDDYMTLRLGMKEILAQKQGKAK